MQNRKQTRSMVLKMGMMMTIAMMVIFMRMMKSGA